MSKDGLFYKEKNMTAKAKTKNPKEVSTDEIIRYEAGEMSEDEVLDMFQRLIDSGMAWKLQGSYGRMAKNLIDAGFCRLLH